MWSPPTADSISTPFDHPPCNQNCPFRTDSHCASVISFSRMNPGVSPVTMPFATSYACPNTPLLAMAYVMCLVLTRMTPMRGSSGPPSCFPSPRFRCQYRKILGSDASDLRTEIAHPSLERGRVVLADQFPVGGDLGMAGDRGPLAGGGEEGDVDDGVGGKVVGLAGGGVGVEDEVNAVALLCGRSLGSSGRARMT